MQKKTHAEKLFHFNSSYLFTVCYSVFGAVRDLKCSIIICCVQNMNQLMKKWQFFKLGTSRIKLCKRRSNKKPRDRGTSPVLPSSIPIESSEFYINKHCLNKGIILLVIIWRVSSYRLLVICPRTSGTSEEKPFAVYNILSPSN